MTEIDLELERPDKDIGHRVNLRWLRDDDGKIEGALLWHDGGQNSPNIEAFPREPARVMLGSEQVSPNQWGWNGSEESPTFTPSVLCGCGWHGFVRNGKWEPC